VRVATLNAFGRRENWAARREVMASGFAAFGADAVALQEVIASAEHDQVRDVLGESYSVVHHPSESPTDRESRSPPAGRSPRCTWRTHLGPRPAGFACRR
jgi:mRNA deadenylase 3'-5' endonuclease subunit Ccr4